MKYNPQIHHRRSIRLKNYDYSLNGAYFVTICTQNRQCLFGEINEGAMNINLAGQMVQTIWQELPQRFPQVEIDKFVVMPNHFHGILWIHNSVGASLVDAQNVDFSQKQVKLGSIVGAFKSTTTHQYVMGVRNNNWQEFIGKLWQRNYFEHIIRDEESLLKIRQYIQNNPLNWSTDAENPSVNK